MNVKATNSNRIYEENIILEKQLQAKMERTDQLAEENMMLKVVLRCCDSILLKTTLLRRHNCELP